MLFTEIISILHKNEYEAAQKSQLRWDGGTELCQHSTATSAVRLPMKYEVPGFPPSRQPARHALPAASSAQAGLLTGAVTLEIKVLQLLLLALMRGTWVLSWPEGSSSSLILSLHHLNGF